MKHLLERIRGEVEQVVVGQTESVELIVAAAVIGGHVLLEGVPGTAKTLVADATARALQATFRRVQFTPDMLPSDLTGTMTLRGTELVFRPGPVFANVLLADEINRTPPKTQSALLEAMQEAQITIDGASRALPVPFLVIATQNPIDHEGTYPLPEAQLDRFLFKLDVGYPGADDERALLRLERHGLRSTGLDRIRGVVSSDELAAARRALDETTATDAVIGFVVDIVRETRTLPSVAIGASPRSAVHLLAAARAGARLTGRDFVTPDDVARMAPPVLRHRLVLTADAELERFSADDAVAAALGAVPVPR